MDREKWMPIAKDFAAGSAGGVSSMIIGYPFDTIKVLLQDGSGNTPKFRNGFQALKYTIQMDGIRGVYKGLSVPLVSVSIINSIFFATNNYCQKYLHPDTTTPIPYHKVALAGGIAGGVISFFITPRDLIKSKLQVQNRNTNLMATVNVAGHPQPTVYRGPVDCIRSIVKTEGKLGMFKGLKVTFIRDFLGDMVYFCTYEFMKRRLLQLANNNNPNANPNDKTTLPAWVAIGAGGCAGMSFWASIYPLDVIKTRIQTQTVSSTIQYTSIIQCAKSIYAAEGMGMFYRGFSATILRSFPTSAMNFATYEAVRKLLNSKFHDDHYASSLEAT